MKRILFLTALLVVSSVTLAEETPDAKAVGEIPFTLSEPGIEIGGSLGTPALANLLVGFHFPIAEAAAFVRLSGMYHGRDRTSGLEVDLGCYIDRNPPLLQSVALHLGVNNLYFQSTTRDHYVPYLGAVYSFSNRGFFLKGGFAYPLDPDLRSGYGRDPSVEPVVSAGYTVHLNY